jgi:hypothetical protein
MLGYIGRINDRDLEKIEEREHDANYRGTDHFGKTGLEQHYEFELHGISRLRAGRGRCRRPCGAHPVAHRRRWPATT